jgi:crotonobetainyl-CoA:carnitine CoA-transferase CaiB-like acyl-CoA transferase
VPVGPINGVDEAFELAESLGLAPVTQVDGMPLPRPPLALSESLAAVRRRPPRLDEHGDEIRAWLTRGS